MNVHQVEEVSKIKKFFTYVGNSLQDRLFYISYKTMQVNSVGMTTYQFMIVIEYMQYIYYLIHPDNTDLWNLGSFDLIQNIIKYTQIQWYSKIYSSGASLFFFFISLILVYLTMTLMFSVKIEKSTMNKNEDNKQIKESNKTVNKINKKNTTNDLNLAYIYFGWYYMLFDTIMFIPMVHAIGTQLLCPKDSCFQQNSLYIINFVLAIIGFIMILLQTAYHLVLNNDINPFSPYIFVGASQQIRSLKFFTKISLVIYLIIDETMESFNIFYFIVFVFIFGVLVLRINNLMEIFNSQVLKLHLFFEFLLLWLCFVVIIKVNLFDSYQENMDLVYIGIGCIFCLVLTEVILKSKDFKNISLDVSQTQKLDRFNNYLMSMIIVVENLENRDNYMKFLGILAYHQSKCSDIDCVCVNLNYKDKDSSFLTEIRIAFYSFVQTKAVQYQDKSQKQKILNLIMCFINYERLGMNFKVIRDIQRLTQIGLSKKEQFYCYILEKKIEEKLKFQDMIDNINQEFNITDAALFQYQFNIFIAQLRISTQFFKQFWTELREQVPDLGLLQSYCKKIQQSLLNCGGQFQRLLQISDENIYIFQIYSEFVQQVVQDNDQFQKLQNKIQFQLKDSRNNNKLELSSKKVLENSIIFVTSANQQNVGEIVNINEIFTKKLGYTKQEIIGQNLNTIIPKQILNDHNNTLNEFILNSQQSSVRQLLVTPLDDQGYAVMSNLKSKILPNLSQGLQIISVMNEIYEYSFQPYNYNIQSKKAQESQDEQDYIYHYILYDPDDFSILGCSQSCYEFFGIHKDLTNQNSTNAIQFSIDLICPQISQQEFKHKLQDENKNQGWVVKLDSTMIGQQFLQYQSDSSLQDNESSGANKDVFSNSQNQSNQQKILNQTPDHKLQSSQQNSQLNSDLKPISDLDLQQIQKKYVQTEIKVFFVQKDKFGNILIKFYDVNKPYIPQQLSEQEQKNNQNNNLSVFKQIIMQDEEIEQNDYEYGYDNYGSSSLRSRNKKNISYDQKVNKSSKNIIKSKYGVTSFLAQQQQQQILDEEIQGFKKFSSQHKKNSKFKQSSAEETEAQKRLRIQRQIKKIQHDLQNQKTSLIVYILILLSSTIFALYCGLTIYFYVLKQNQRNNIYNSVGIINNIYSRNKFLPIIVINNQKLHNIQNDITNNDFDWEDEIDYQGYINSLTKINDQIMDVQFQIMQDINTLASFYKTAHVNDLVLNFYNSDTSIYTDDFQISDAMILIFAATKNIGTGGFGSLEEIGTYNSYLQDYHFIKYNAIFPIREEAEKNSGQFVDLYNGYVDQLIVLDITIRVIIMVVVISFIVLIPIVWKIERHNQKIVIIFSHIKTVDINKFLRNIVRYEKKHLIELKPSVILQKIKEQELKEYQEQLQYLNGPDQLEKLNSNNFNNQYKIKVSNNQNINTPNPNQQALNNTNQLNQTNLSANISIRQNLLEDNSNKGIKDVDDIIMKNDIKVDLDDQGEHMQKGENQNQNESESENENEDNSLESQDETVDNKKKNDSKKVSNKSSTNITNPKLQQKNQKNLQEIDEMEEENYVESKNDKLQAQIKINKFSLIWKFAFFLTISLGYLIFDFFNSDTYINNIQYSLDHLKYLSQRPNGLLQLFAFLQREIDESKEQIYLGNNMIDKYTEKIYEIENNLQNSITQDNFPNSFQQYIDNFKNFQNGKICEMEIDINEFDLNDYKVGNKSFQEVCDELLGSVLNKGIKAAILQIIETTRSYQSNYFDELNDLDKNSATYDDDLLALQKEYTFKTQFRQLEALIYLIYPILNYLVNFYETSFQDYITSNSNTLKMYFIFLIIYQLIVYFLLWIPFWVTLRNKLMNSKRMVSIIPVSCIIDPKNKDLKEALVEGEIIQKFRM